MEKTNDDRSPRPTDSQSRKIAARENPPPEKNSSPPRDWVGDRALSGGRRLHSGNQRARCPSPLRRRRPADRERGHADERVGCRAGPGEGVRVTTAPSGADVVSSVAVPRRRGATERGATERGATERGATGGASPLPTTGRAAPLHTATGRASPLHSATGRLATERARPLLTATRRAALPVRQLKPRRRRCRGGRGGRSSLIVSTESRQFRAGGAPRTRRHRVDAGIVGVVRAAGARAMAHR
jgi:hypothetical protein